jgi:hypothetical protein
LGRLSRKTRPINAAKTLEEHRLARVVSGQTNRAEIAQEAEMFPNPYVAQKLAENKIADAHREANKYRLLASLPRKANRRGVNWAMAALVAGTIAVIMLSF